MSNVITRLFSSRADKKKDSAPNDTESFESFEPNVQTKKSVSVNTSFITNPHSDDVQSEKDKKFNSLTPRETDVFSMLVKGMTIKSAAEKLGVTYATVNTHMNAVYRKLGVNSKSQLIVEYHDYG